MSNLLKLPDVYDVLSTYANFYDLLYVSSEFVLKYSFEENSGRFNFLSEAHEVLPEIMNNYNFKDLSLSRILVGACFHSFVTNQMFPINRTSKFNEIVDDIQTLPLALKIILMQRSELGLIVSRDQESIFNLSKKDLKKSLDLPKPSIKIQPSGFIIISLANDAK